MDNNHPLMHIHAQMQGINRIVTMTDLAREAGVSQPTVSRALRNDRRISKSTRDRILALARKRNYRPDPTLSALMVYRSGKKPPSDHGKIAILDLGRVYEKSIKSGQTDHDLNLKFGGIKTRAAELGYITEIFPLGPDILDQKRLSRTLYAQGIRGVIVSPSPKEFPPPVHINWNQFSAVALGFSLESPLLNYVAQDQRCEMLYTKLRELGYRRIGFCSQKSPESNYRHMKLAYYLKCLFMDGISPEQSPPLFYENWRELDPVPWIRQHKFDVIMTSVVSAFQFKLKNTPFASPVRLGLAALSLPADSPKFEDITGIMENISMVGVAAVDLLHQLICQGNRGIPVNRQAIILEGKWHSGKTAPGITPAPPSPQSKKSPKRHTPAKSQVPR